MLKKINNKNWFTLVELIVVIAILIILWTIVFISITWYSKSSRDARRVSDVSNIKKSLELFSINTWKYPVADNPISVSFSWDLLWKQWTLWDNIFRNLSSNLQKKPLDPLYEVEYIYSSTHTQKEYEVMSIFESDIVWNNLMNETFAANKHAVRVEWTFNQLFVMTSNYLFPTPSIISSLGQNTEMTSSWAIASMVVTNWENFPDLNVHATFTKTGSLDLKLSSYKAVNLKSLDDDKVKAIETIQEAFSWSKLQSEVLYKMLLSKDTYDKKLQLADWIFGWNFVWTRLISWNEEQPDTEAPILSLLWPTWTLWTSPLTLTVTTNENAICYFHQTETNYLSMNTFENSWTAIHTHSYIPSDWENNINVICLDLSDNESELWNILFNYLASDPVSINFTETDNEIYTCDLCN